MRALFLALSWVICGVVCRAQSSAMPRVSSGTLTLIASFPSKFTEARPVYIWVPEGYTPTKKYPVLYMHDGAVLFDSTASLSKVDWAVDETLGRLIRAGTIQETIVVGIHNLGKHRHPEYWPQKPYQNMEAEARAQLWAQGVKMGYNREPFSDKYLKYITQEIKPYVDSAYSTYRDAAHTFIAGSSMGGLISWYAICEYPEVFGGAACLSTHWPGVFAANEAIFQSFYAYLSARLPDPKTHKLYMDYGNLTLDSLYTHYQPRVNALLAKKGYKGKNALLKFYSGEGHTEGAWRKRLATPIIFLLKK